DQQEREPLLASTNARARFDIVVQSFHPKAHTVLWLDLLVSVDFQSEWSHIKRLFIGIQREIRELLFLRLLLGIEVGESAQEGRDGLFFPGQIRLVGGAPGRGP